MLSAFRERVSLVLLFLLPFHALAVTAATRVIAGAGHAPLGILALWKEGLLGALLIAASWEILAARGAMLRRWDRLDALAAAFCVTAMLASILAGSTLGAVALGARYDLVTLVAFVVLRRVPWSPGFAEKAARALLAAGCCVAGYGVLTLLLPDRFFATLGYSPLHSLYVPGGPVAAFQYIGGEAVRRIQGPVSGPNQLGVWLLLPWAAAQGKQSGQWTVDSGQWRNGLLILFGAAIALTFSRAAWIGAGIVALVFLLRGGRTRRRIAVAGAGMVACAACVLLLVRPQLLLRAASSRDHVLRPLAAVAKIIERPLGWGLGSAGPASNRLSDACVELEAGADATWAQAHPQLCVFVGGTQVQPFDAAQGRPTPCRCPFLPENWYLQIGVEAGVIGFLLYGALILLVLVRLRRADPPWVFPAFLAVSIAAVFLHAWEDAAASYSLWIVAAAVIPVLGPAPRSSPLRA